MISNWLNMFNLSLLKFADSNASYEEADIVIMGNPFDITSSYRPGSRFAPDQIRDASWNFETWLFDYEVDLAMLNVHDLGNFRQFGSSEEMYEEVRKTISQIIKDKKIPITFGGDHSITIPIIDSYKEDITVLAIDAHLDFRDQYENNKYNHACVIRRIFDHLGKNNVMAIGTRSICKEEWEDAKKLGLHYIPSYNIIEDEKNLWEDPFFKNLKGKKIYITIDIDGIDPAYAPGTGTPEPFGLSPYLVKKIIKYAGENLVGFDVTEVSPPYDNGNTAAIAARFARDAIANWAKSRNVT